MRAITRCTLFVALVSLVFAVGVAQAEPLSLAGLLTQVKFRAEQDVVNSIAKSGVAFDASPENLEKLRSTGASGAVLAAVKEAAQSRQQPAAGPPISYDDVKNLLSGGASEAEISRYLNNSPTFFVLSADQERELRRLGASDDLIEKIKGRGRTPQGSTEVTHLALVLDCSASMKEKTGDGRTKMEVARTVLADLVEKVPGHLGLVFVIYGHDAELKCQAVEVSLASETFPDEAKSRLRSRIMRLRPAGQTPMALGLKVAGRELAKQPGGCGLILISDGKENCHGDPVAEIANLARELPIAFGAHVIGFDVDAAGKAQLNAVADAAGGEYYNARNTEELETAVAALEERLAKIDRPEGRTATALEWPGKRGQAGAYFHDAGLIEPDQEYAGKLEMMQAHFYQIPVARGQELRAIAQVQKAPYEGKDKEVQTFSITIYDRDLNEVAHAPVAVPGRSETPATPRAVWTAPEDTIAYVVLAASDSLDADGVSQYVVSKEPLEPSEYKLKVRISGEGTPDVRPVPRRDAEPGNNFRTAGAISAPGLATTDIKLDEVRFFRTSVSEGEKLRVTLAPTKPWHLAYGYSTLRGPNPEATEATYTVAIFDDDQVKVAEKQLVVSANPPHPRSTVLEWDVNLSGSAWISVGLANSGGEVYFHTMKNHARYAPVPFLDQEGQPLPGYVAVQVTKPTEAEADPFAGAEGASR